MLTILHYTSPLKPSVGFKNAVLGILFASILVLPIGERTSEHGMIS